MASAAHWQKIRGLHKNGVSLKFLHDDSNKGGLDVHFGFMSFPTLVCNISI